ncbi:MAG: T9SS type A sorting domain-containing protein [Bacteroidales bacterium]|nr:T9SS type A sorting domain-containing protein [Bacteroidales bacterium]
MKYSISIFFVLGILTTYSQSTFFTHFPKPGFEKGCDAAETSDNSLIIAGYTDPDNLYIYNGCLLKLSSEGELLKESILVRENQSILLIKILGIPNNDQQFLCIGSSDSVFNTHIKNKLIFNIIDTTLQILDSCFYHTELDKILQPQAIDLWNDSILFLLNGYSSNPFNGIQLGVVKIKLPFDSIASVFFESIYEYFPQDILWVDSKVKVFYMFGPPVGNGLANMLELDENLNYLGSKPAPEGICSSLASEYKNDTCYILTGTWDDPFGPQTIRTYLMDLNDDTIQSLLFPRHNDTILYGGGCTNTVFNGNEIFVAGVLNLIPSQFPYQQSSSWIQVSRISNDFSLLSQTYYGGDAFYYPFSIIPTQDGGAFLTGYRYDYTMPENDLDIFALKVDSFGLVTNIPEDASWQMNDAILCPNPGFEYGIAIVGAQHPQATLFLYDLNGRLVMERPLNQHQTRIQTTSLPTGTYIYTFVAYEKVIGTGKWVKQ